MASNKSKKNTLKIYIYHKLAFTHNPLFVFFFTQIEPYFISHTLILLKSCTHNDRMKRRKSYETSKVRMKKWNEPKR